MTIQPAYPHYCVWEITLVCNMSCLHCGSYAGRSREQEMSLEQMLDVADQLADIGVKRLTLSGGEPLLRPDWDIIAKRLIDRGVHTGMISNGFKMLDNLEKFEKLHGMEVIAMSLDGMRETHDAFRRVPGSFDRIVAAFKALHARGFYTAAITSISNLNIHELDEMHDLLVSLNADAWQLQTLFGGGRMRERPDLMPGPDGVEKVARFIARKHAAKTPLNIFPADCIGYGTELEPQIRTSPWGGCQAGLRAIGIEANGNVKGCLSLYPELQEGNPFVEGNLQKEKLIDIWNKPGAFSYNRDFRPSRAQGYCRDCQLLNKCRCGCSAQAYFSSGTTYENPYCMLYNRMSKAAQAANAETAQTSAKGSIPTLAPSDTGTGLIAKSAEYMKATEKHPAVPQPAEIKAPKAKSSKTKAAGTAKQKAAPIAEKQPAKAAPKAKAEPKAKTAPKAKAAPKAEKAEKPAAKAKGASRTAKTSPKGK